MAKQFCFGQVGQIATVLALALGFFDLPEIAAAGSPSPPTQGGGQAVDPGPRTTPRAIDFGRSIQFLERSLARPA